ncbi:MAG: helix-turn-helix domain-containing protein [Polyangiaceae bacterium]
MNPLPGRAVRGSRTGRPIMAALDLLGRRWTLRIVWELCAEPLSFRALQTACEVAPSVLNTRLAELREAGIVETKETGYALSERGRALVDALEPLFGWAERWAAATTSASAEKAKRRER